MNDTARKIKADVEIARTQAWKEITLGIISQPVISLVGGVAAIEYLERQGYIGNVIATTTEAGMILICAMQAAAPIRTEMAQALGTIAPLIGMVK